jgi:hypothetical protein
MLAGGVLGLLLSEWWVAAGVVVGLPALLFFHIFWRDHARDVRGSVRCFFLLAGAKLRKELARDRRRLYRLVEAARERLRDPEDDAGAGAD